MVATRKISGMMGFNMTLREFKDAGKKGDGKKPYLMEELADLLGLSIGHTSDLVNGRRSCSLEVAVRIERITKGAVSCRDIVAAVV